MSTQDETLHDEANSEALAPGSKLLSGQYEIVRYLSSGGFGITYLAKDSLNRTVVIKECFPEAFCSRVKKTVRARTKNYVDDFRSIVALFIREAHALSRLDHSSVVGVHQVFEYNETAYMALDLVDGKDLLEIIESGAPAMSAAQVQSLTLSLLDAIAHVHSQDLLHRDISPDNILVDKSGRPVLIDFGAAREEASRKSRVLSAVLVVKDGYSPQEFYVAGSQQYPCSDLYALAATLTHLISGKAPPNSQARLAALASHQPDLYEPLRGRFPAYDDDFLAAIDKAMNIVPADRIQSAQEWALMIDPTRRAEIARARARDDQTINLTISNLIQSVQDDKEDAAPVEVAPVPEVKPEAEIPEPWDTKPVDPKYDAAFFRDLYDSETPEEQGDTAVPEASAQDMSSADRKMIDRVSDKAAAADPVSSVSAPSGEKQTRSKVSVTPAAVVTTKSRIFKEEISTPRPAAKKEVSQARPKKYKTLPDVISQQDFDALMAAERSVARSSIWRRWATLPVILVAYFMLGQAALQFDDFHAVTVGKLLNMGEDYGYWTINQRYTAGG
ncbi:serine/threonine-protein kinase [uncultured Roseobacter sp.]|uniref:serine/threonine protein kinase n=1 Tax=uncultured Roseobacter sp. TaxID=114847 RepID=UPI0026107D6F|nr:serine/threonine-protein kinase [uncultured Roseobacter sp.]